MAPHHLEAPSVSADVASRSAVWGIDLGGTKIEGVVLAEGSSQPLCRIRIPTEQERGYRHIVARILRLIEQMSAKVRMEPRTVGVGTPGSTEPATGLLKNSNTVCLNGQPLLADLAAALGIPVRLANDANCFALAEATLGAGRGAETVFGVILGTGVGGGIVVNGSVLSGANGIAGEWGHNPLEPEGESCYCGKRGCVETVISGPALERFYASRAGTVKSLPEIVKLSRIGDHDAAKTVDRLVEKFGQAVAVVANILDPDVIVLGGGVGQIEELYTRGPAALKAYTFGPVRTRIVRPQLGDSAGVFGAAMLCRGSVETKVQ